VRASEQSEERLIWVYEAIGADLKVLYVGVSTGLTSRMISHKAKPWYLSMRYLRLTLFSDRVSAYAFENQRIKETMAPNNIAGNPIYKSNGPSGFKGFDRKAADILKIEDVEAE
jgi:hypothetical protein